MTNLNVEVYPPLKQAGDDLIRAARIFWESHRRACGPSAVVWLRDTSGHLIVFTRWEYADQVMRNIEPIFRDERPLVEPFIVES